jgi:hypothetical protein
VLCLVAILVLSGCERMARVRDCKRLSALVNPQMGEVEALAKKGKPADYRGAARIYGRLGKDLRRSATPSPTGKVLVEEYATVLDAVAPAVSAYAVALESQDAQQLEEARRDIDRLAKRQQGMVARIDAYCRAP